MAVEGPSTLEIVVHFHVQGDKLVATVSKDPPLATSHATRTTALLSVTLGSMLLAGFNKPSIRVLGMCALAMYFMPKASSECSFVTVGILLPTNFGAGTLDAIPLAFADSKSPSSSPSSGRQASSGTSTCGPVPKWSPGVNELGCCVLH